MERTDTTQLCPISVVGLVRTHGWRDGRARRTAGLWVLLVTPGIALSLATTALALSTPSPLGQLALALPMSYVLLLTLWMGPEWGLGAALPAALLSGFYASLSAPWALAVALAQLLPPLTAYALYRAFPRSLDLRRPLDLGFFALVGLAVAANNAPATLLLGQALGLPQGQTLAQSLAWTAGLSLPALLLSGLLLFAATRGVARIKARWWGEAPTLPATVRWQAAAVGLVALSLLCAVLILGSRVQLTTEEAMVQEFNQGQLREATAVAGHLEHHLMGWQSELQFLNSRPGVQYLEKQRQQEFLEEAFQRLEAEYVLAIARLDTEGRAVTLVSADGISMAPTGPALSLVEGPFAETGYFAWARRPQSRGQTHWSELIVPQEGPWAAKVLLLLVAPTYEETATPAQPEPSQEFAGALLFVTDVGRLVREHIALMLARGESRAWVIDEQGLILAHPDRSLVGQTMEVFADAPTYGELRAVLERMRRGEEGTGRFLYRHQEAGLPSVLEDHLIAFAPFQVGDRAWSVGVAGHRRDVLALVRAAWVQQMCLLALVALIILGGAGGVVWILSRYTAEIRAAREYLETLLGSLHDQVLVIDRDYRISDVNAAFLRQMGYSREEVIGRHCYEVTHGRSGPCAGAGHPCPAQQVWKSGQPARATHTHYDHEGKICWIAIAASPVRDAGGRVMGVIEVHRDVTGEHQLEEKLAAIHALGHELVLATDEGHIAQAVVEAAERVLKFRMCGLWLVDEKGEELVRRAATAAGEAVDIPPLLLEGERGIIVAVARSREPIYLSDVQQDPRHIDAGLGSRSELCVPLKVGERVIGVLNAESERLDAFDQVDMQLLSTLADHAALALENTRLFEEEERRVAQLRAISEVGKDIASILDLDELLHRVVNLLVEVFGYYYAHVLMVDEEAQEIVATATAGQTGRPFEGLRLKMGEQGITGWVAASGEPLLVNDVDKEPRYYFAEELADTKSELAVPIKLKGEVIGVLDVQSNEPGAFDEVDLSTLTTLADQLAVAIENARLYQETERLAITDGLTGLYNRRQFYELLEREVELVKRYDGHLSLIMLDIDGFKTYNDIYGHLVGDALLRELAQLLTRDIRKVDVAARYGGDEFVIFFPHTGKKEAAAMGERIRTSVEECEFCGEEVLPTGEITISVGVATCPEDAVESEALVNAADMALLEAKKWRNRVCTCGE